MPEYQFMPYGIWLILGALLLIVIAVFLTAGVIDTLLFIAAAILLVLGVVYLIRGRRSAI